MKVVLCDVCLAETDNKTISKRYWTAKSPFGNIRVDVCEKHRDWGKGKTHDDFMKLIVKSREK